MSLLLLSHILLSVVAILLAWIPVFQTIKNTSLLQKITKNANYSLILSVISGFLLMIENPNSLTHACVMGVLMVIVTKSATLFIKKSATKSTLDTEKL